MLLSSLSSIADRKWLKKTCVGTPSVALLAMEWVLNVPVDLRYSVKTWVDLRRFVSHTLQYGLTSACPSMPLDLRHSVKLWLDLRLFVKLWLDLRSFVNTTPKIWTYVKMYISTTIRDRKTGWTPNRGNSKLYFISLKISKWPKMDLRQFVKTSVTWQSRSRSPRGPRLAPPSPLGGGTTTVVTAPLICMWCTAPTPHSLSPRGHGARPVTWSWLLSPAFSRLRWVHFGLASKAFAPAPHGAHLTPNRSPSRLALAESARNCPDRPTAL